jgi:hypothetical protein
MIKAMRTMIVIDESNIVGGGRTRRRWRPRKTERRLVFGKEEEQFFSLSLC